MIKKDLLQFITDGEERAHGFQLERWIESSDRFNSFVANYKEKIRRKLRKAKSDEANKDVLLELNVAYSLLLNNDLEIEYEKYGTEDARTPDYFITIKKTVGFNVEVTRVHETDISSKYNNCIYAIAEEITKIPSELSFSINWVTCKPKNNLVYVLEEWMDKIISFTKENIENEQNSIAPGQGKEFVIPLPEFGGNLQLGLSKPLSKLDTTKTTHNLGSRPVFYTQKEYRKIGDVIFDKVGQMIPNMINVLLIGADNTTFEKEDVPETIFSINELISRRDDGFFAKKKFEGAAHFVKEVKNLSGILFRGSFISRESRNKNYLWQNSDANMPIPNSIAQLLENLK